MRRGAILERIKKEAESGPRFFFPDPKEIEHLVLDIAAVNTETAPAQLGPVQDKIISLRTDSQRILVK